VKKNKYLRAGRQTRKIETTFYEILYNSINDKKAEQDQEMDKAFESLVHELMMMECFLDRDINCLTDFELDMYRNDMLISAEEFTVRFLKKVEDSL